MKQFSAVSYKFLYVGRNYDNGSVNNYVLHALTCKICDLRDGEGVSLDTGYFRRNIPSSSSSVPFTACGT
jgi:hypothetical protein